MVKGPTTESFREMDKGVHGSHHGLRGVVPFVNSVASVAAFKTAASDWLAQATTTKRAAAEPMQAPNN
jgi:hypothetical protein